MPNILLIDDHAILRAGARVLVERHVADAEVAEAGSLAEALALIQGGFEADVALLDIQLPDASGAESLTLLRQRYPSMPVLVLSGSTGEAAAMLARGASAFVAKAGDPFEMIGALQAVLQGEAYVAGSFDRATVWAGLSERQRALLALCADGRSNKEIGRALGISDNTVRAHLALLYRRFGVKNRGALAAIAMPLGSG